ncbi:16S rRNA (cytidine(1402)-2'-O)-methyltransferase [Schleiferia thermophila]|jgi:16S rRNA (cytidine1402-2'-O)-methyltransferase|uniref:Ribosomal RNA small subunit methyltransferase I n=1 Tax=Schleiferia thermophila TaxID=884107 RepID=A0A369A370_9FLAO|nr:16S rRNA (cytidine(1402)-2'-O)-methyltransferase [Schleiferia thermophila]KFD38510.1 16S rRNA methyltransferase [Schleiferia thermophila str. Yellowstone]PMB22819.1 rRNA (cytidine-2'-O-)-methyltransferase [Fischerella thermalis CCMEE 5319]RCX03631.1 16S rRNA (cytidine1402-2'-O)-methyltransferase [Schleiferia thermophila]GCD79865.1 ribosomal RNA small subunit methyltransferase I [Schleiferia thermophila]
MGKLYVVPTPIGNLEDITLRALRILKDVDIIYCEDTRTSSVLMAHYQITTPLKSYHMHNEHAVTAQIVGKLLGEFKAALISDAGTPAISDPGFLLVRECIKAGIEVECLPGPTAFVPALVESGLSCEQFFFLGFPPVKKGRSTFFNRLAEIDETIVLYESPHKIEKTLNDIAVHLGPDRNISVSRELSKKFHQTLRGTVTELTEAIKKQPLRGEIVIVIGKKLHRKEHST